MTTTTTIETTTTTAAISLSSFDNDKNKNKNKNKLEAVTSGIPGKYCIDILKKQSNQTKRCWSLQNIV